MVNAQVLDVVTKQVAGDCSAILPMVQFVFLATLVASCVFMYANKRLTWTF